MTDPIADMLTRIRNASAVHKAEVRMPFSKMKMGIADILVHEGFIRRAEKISKGTEGSRFDELRLELKYEGLRTPVIQDLKRVSTPGRRLYVTKDTIPVVLNNLGIAIISTSRGLMTNKEARKAGLGGEVICEIY